MPAAANTPAPFDLEAYLAAYRPIPLDPDEWALVESGAHALLRTIQPKTMHDAKAHLAALARFLDRLRETGHVSLDLLTADNLTRFCALEKAAGANPGTMGHVRPRLNRLLAANENRPSITRGAEERRRVVPLDPYSDQDMATLKAARNAADPRDALTLDLLVLLADGHGCPRGHVHDARVEGVELVLGAHRRLLSPDDPLRELAAGGPVGIDKRDWARAREVLKAAGLSPLHHRLRHRWLLRLLMGPGSVASAMASGGLTRDDIDTVASALPEAPDCGAVMRSM